MDVSTNAPPFQDTNSHCVGSKIRTAHRAIVAAIDTGIMAAMGPGGTWNVFCGMTRHLPNIRPSRNTIAKLSGIHVCSVNRHTQRMIRAGLLERELRYRDGGGRLPTRYVLADISDPAVVAGILSRLKSQNAPAQLDPPESKRTGANTLGAPAQLSTKRQRSLNLISESSKASTSNLPAAGSTLPRDEDF